MALDTRVFVANNYFSEDEIKKLNELNLKAGVSISIADIEKVSKAISPKLAKENDITNKLLNLANKIMVKKWLIFKYQIQV